MKKRIVSFLMALVMAVSLLPVSALAADTIYTNDSDTSVKAETQSSGVYKDADDTVVTNMKVRYGKGYLPDFFEKGKKEYTLAVPEGWTGLLTYLDVYVNEIAKILGIGRTAAYSLVHSGVFKMVRIGSSIRVSKVSFDDWLDKQTL